jgi:hypothetical protein
MADDLLRRWDLSDSQLLAYFNATYPQTHSWEPARANLLHNKGLVDAALQSGLSIGCQTVALTYWRIWSDFCLQHHLDPYCSQGPDAMYWLQIFAVRVRMGRLSASGNPVRADMVANTLARRTQWPTSQTLAMYRDQQSSTHGLSASSMASENRTQHQREPFQSPYKSFNARLPLPPFATPHSHWVPRT